ncbi:hypothetical protein ACS0TY_009077 [Phlomoides rotata]
MADAEPKAEDEEEGGREINGDVLETIFSNVPVVDLVSPSRVSRLWRGAVSSSLRHRNPLKPWLLLHTQSTRFPHATTFHAYDPRSDVWIRILRPPIDYVSALKSPHSNFLYMLSPATFSFSYDPLNTDWLTVSPPRVWRTDPVVARAGDSVVVAGGVCYFEDDPLAVEVYDLRARAWRTCESMPGNLKDSAAASWISTAATGQKLVLTEKQSGVTHSFDPVSGSWAGPFYLKSDRPVISYQIGWSDANGLILAGICGSEDAERIIIWGIREDDFSCEEIGEMPEEFVSSLRSDSDNSSINIRVAGNIVYVYSTGEAEKVVACEMIDGGGCRWWRVRNVVARERMITENLVFSCSEVGIGEVQWAMRMNNWRFEIVE